MGTNKYWNPGATLDVTNGDTSDETDINDVVDELADAFNAVEDDLTFLVPTLDNAKVEVSTTNNILDITEIPPHDLIAYTVYEITTLNDAAAEVTDFSTDGTLAGNADTVVPTEKAVKTYADTKLPSSYLDTDGTLTANSDVKVASQKATKTYVDATLNPLSQKENLIINPSLLVNQRLVGAVTSTGYVADRWKVVQPVGGTFSSGIVTGGVLPVIGLFNYVSLQNLLSANPLANPGDYTPYIEYTIEGVDCYQFQGAGVYLTFSFYVYVNVGGTYCLSIETNGPLNFYSYVYDFTAVTGGWQRVTKTVSMVEPEIMDIIDRGITIRIGAATGGSYRVAAINTWEDSGVATAGKISSANATNWTSAINKFLYVTNLKVEYGSVATPFVIPTFGTELTRCQRYYQKSYNYASAPGTAEDLGATYVTNYSAGALGTIYENMSYRTSMRTAPTATIYSPTTGTAGEAYALTAAADKTTNAGDVGESCFSKLSLQGGDTVAAGDTLKFHYTLDADF